MGESFDYLPNQNGFSTEPGNVHRGNKDASLVEFYLIRDSAMTMLVDIEFFAEKIGR